MPPRVLRKPAQPESMPEFDMQSREEVNRSESGEYTDVEFYKLTATFSSAKDQTRLVGQLPWTEILFDRLPTRRTTKE